MEQPASIDPAIRGRDYSVNFRDLTPAELAERRKARAEDEARDAIERLKPNGKAFEIDPGYEASESLRRGDGLTEWDSIKYGGALILLPLLLLACVIGFFWSWLA